MRDSLIAPSFLAFAAQDALRGGAPQAVAEIVTFRLVSGTDPDQVAPAAGGLMPFLESTGAMVSRTLSVDDNGLWTDHIIWTSLTAAKEAAERVMSRPEAAPFMTMIDPASVSLRHATILLSQPPE